MAKLCTTNLRDIAVKKRGNKAISIYVTTVIRKLYRKPKLLQIIGERSRLTGEVDRKLCIAAHARIWYIRMNMFYFRRTFISWRPHGRAYGIDLEEVVVYDEENGCRFEDYRIPTGSTCNLCGQWLSGKGCWSFLLPKLAQIINMLWYRM